MAFGRRTRTYSQTVTVAHAQILTLPTASVTLVSAPATGFMLMPTWITYRLRIPTTAYTNVAVAPALQTGFSGGQTLTYGANPDFTATQDIVFYDPLGAQLSAAVATNKESALVLICTNGLLGNFTGGASGNSLEVFLEYFVRPI